MSKGRTGDRPRRSVASIVAVGAVALGLGAGSYGIASAASGNGSSATGSSSSAAPAVVAAPAALAARTANPSAPSAQHPWGGQRSDETPLTGDTLAKVTAAANAKVSGATIVRVETDADGNAPYEAHVVKSDGTRATVYVDKQFNVVSVQTR